MDFEQADKSLRKPGKIYDERADNPKRPIFLNDKTRRVFLSLTLIAIVSIHIACKGAFAEEQSKEDVGSCNNTTAPGSNLYANSAYISRKFAAVP